MDALVNEKFKEVMNMAMEDFEKDGGNSDKEKEFRAEEDARILQKFGEIVNDPQRHARAKSKLVSMIASMKRAHSVMGKGKKISAQAEFEKTRESQGAKKF